jgi:hypothetical protein
VSYQCAYCGELHDDLPLSYKFDKPGLDPQGNRFEYSRDGELCAIGTNRFILANIELPYCDGKTFVWTCWISLSDESYRRIDARWDSADRESDEPALGWLSNDLPSYERSTWALKARVHQNPLGHRPWVELEPTDHLLAVEQREGITGARIEEIYHSFARVDT